MVKKIMEITNNTYLKFIDFNDLSLWDVKRLFLSSLKSEYNIVSLKEVIKERSEKVKLFEFEKQEFGILGVNNKVGIFDSYVEKSENINQAYKKVYEGDLAYNPYRVNVGSVGLKTKENNFEYISPAYVVFSCDKEKLLSEYFYILFKTDYFNKAVNDNTTGSVRQNLKFSTLAEIKIPLPSLEEQKRIVEEYNKKLENSLNAEVKSGELEKEIENYLMEELGIEVKENKNLIKGLKLVQFKDLDKWNVWNEQVFVKCNKYETIKILDSLRNINSKIDKVQTKDYLENGKVPIVSQEINLISGYTNKNLTTINGTDLPLIVFGDHSKTVKYIDFEFICGADGVRLMKPILEFNSKFYYYYISLVLNFINPIESYTRHWKYLSQINIPLPPLEIQEKIVKDIGILKDEIKRLQKLREELKENAKAEFEGKIFS